MERPAGRRWLSWCGRGDAGRPAGMRGGGRYPGEPLVPPVLDGRGPVWSAALHLGGGRTLEASYPVDPPLVIGAPLPRIAVRSLPTAPLFRLDLRLSTAASLLYVGVLQFTDSRSRPGRARVAGTWSAPTGTFWGTWLAAASHRGTVRITLRQD